MRTLPAFALLGALLFVPTAVAAQGLDRAAEYRARGVERSTLSPFCPGRTLYDCPSPRAAAWRADIRRWIREGRSEAEIREALQARAPDVDLDGGRPGDGTVAALFLLSLAILGAFVARQLRRAPAEPSVATPDVLGEDDEALESLLDEELRQLERP